MGLDKTVYKVARKLGSDEVRVYAKTGELIGTERCFINPFKRSADEDIAQFGRSGMFHYATYLTEGCLVVDTNTGEEFIVSAKRGQKFKRKTTHYSIYLLKINAVATVKRTGITVSDMALAEASYVESTLYENIRCYILKKDWTMEQVTQIGREQRGYEQIVLQDTYEVQKGDRIICDENVYIVQYILRYKKEGYLQIQGGVDVF